MYAFWNAFKPDVAVDQSSLGRPQNSLLLSTIQRTECAASSNQSFASVNQLLRSKAVPDADAYCLAREYVHDTSSHPSFRSRSATQTIDSLWDRHCSDGLGGWTRRPGGSKYRVLRLAGVRWDVVVGRGKRSVLQSVILGRWAFSAVTRAKTQLHKALRSFGITP